MATRRRFLIGAAAATTGLAATAGSATAQAQTFELELNGEDGFVGVSPSSIEGEANPTLEVEAGNRYRIEYTANYIPQLQGLPGRHNMVIRTEDGTLRRTNYVFQEGATQGVGFQASSNLTTWGCEEHSYVFEGEVQASWDDYPQEGGQFEVSGGDGGMTDTATDTPMDGGDGGMTDTATDTPMDGGDGETNGGGPGFGVGAAVTAIGAAAYGALRKNSDE